MLTLTDLRLLSQSPEIRRDLKKAPQVSRLIRRLKQRDSAHMGGVRPAISAALERK